jgi:hypothetical protein
MALSRRGQKPMQTNAKGSYQQPVKLLRTGKIRLNHSCLPTSVENARVSVGFCRKRTIARPSWHDGFVPVPAIR